MSETETQRKPEIARAIEVADKIGPMLRGHGSVVQAAALALLTATWCCGHHPASQRERLLRLHFSGVRRMVKQLSETETGERH